MIVKNKNMYNLIKGLHFNKCCYLKFLLIKGILKQMFQFPKKATIFNIDNNKKCFLSTKSVY